jgi:hypothetical protein
MIIDLSPSIRTARITSVLTGIDADSGSAKLKLYSGTKPTAGDAITDQILVGTFIFTDPAGTVTNQTLTLTVAGDILAVATDTITWARITTSADVWCIDLDVTDNLGTGAIKIDNTAVTTGGTIKLLSATLSD